MLNSKSKSSGQAQILASLDGRGKQKQLFLNDPAVSGLVQPPFSSVRSLHTYQLSSRSGSNLCAPSEAHQINMSKQPMSFSVTWCAYLYIFCARDEHEVVRLLAPKTVGIAQEFFKYLKERKLPELAALLMVAREYIMPGGSEERLKIQDFVQKEIAALETSLFRFTYGINNDKLILEAQIKKLEMEAILVLLQIFESIGDKIAAYLRLPYWTSELEQIGEVSLLLKEAGLDAEPVLLAEESRQCSLYDFLHITSPVRKYPIIEKTSNEMNQHTSDKALGEYEKGKSYHKAFGKAIADGEQCSMLWLRNKQNLLDKFKLFRDYMSSRSYHTYHPLRATRDLGSTTANKVNDLALKLQLKKQYLGRAGQDCGNSAKITTGCSWGSNLQFNRYCALPPTLSRRIIWMTSKLARAL